MILIQQPIEPGCFIDGHHGHYVVPMSISLAMDYGFDPGATVAALVARYSLSWHLFTNDQHEALVEESDAALEYLSARTEGGYWEWVDGELFLTADEDEGEA